MIFIVSSLASEFSYGTPDKIAIDFGLGLLTISLVGVSIFMGSTLLANEIESKTIYMILSRDLERWQFFCGRILGMLLILTILLVLLGGIVLGCFTFYEGVLEPLIFWAFLFIFFEAMIILSIVILLSLITNKTMTVIYAIMIYIIAHALTPIQELQYVTYRQNLHLFMKGIGYLFPDFSKFNIKNFILYTSDLETSYLLMQVLYATSYFVGILFLITIIFKRKDLN